MTTSLLRRLPLVALPLLAALTLMVATPAAAQSGVDPAVTQGTDVPTVGTPPSAAGATATAPEGQPTVDPLGNEKDSELWRSIREGTFGTVSIPDKNAARLIQSEGENWRVVRNGALSYYGIWGLLLVVALLALFFLVRGRIMIEGGKDGRTVLRFGFIERTAHWLIAVSFIVLALTGLNLLYGRYVLLPVIGPDLFGTLTVGGKYVHNYVSFAFMLGLVAILVLWIGRNLPTLVDLKWLAKAGGLFSRHGHASSYKFNAGQKILYWLVLLLGISVSLSGVALLFPYQLPLFSKTFEALNAIGFDLPANLSVLQEMQLAQVWHAIVGLVMIAIIIGHIYIGTVGMQGAFAAMGSGQVDLNWAREHHDLWVEDKLARRGDEAVHGDVRAHPAE